jgi:MoCo/4Fe-4S cofactor protein with predicted Tat translocation signal
MSTSKTYWKNIADLKSNPELDPNRHNEFVEHIPVDEFLGDKGTLENSQTSRRDFLKYVGFSTAAATLAACEGPVIKSIPYVVQPESIVPGIANYYATSIANGYDFASILVKTREGRPILINNNKLDQSGVGANARVNASVLDLYDSQRLKAPQISGTPTSWVTFNSEIGQKLNDLTAQLKPIVLLTQTFASPSTTALVNEFLSKFPSAKHLTYDAISQSAALDAFEQRYGKRAMADYDFSKALFIVSIGADFLGDWQGGGFDGGYSKSRMPQNGMMSRHVQFESNMSLTGANADKRIPLKPAHQKQVLAALYAKLKGTSIQTNLSDSVLSTVNQTAKSLQKSGSNAVVVTGLDDVDAQALVLEINTLLGSKAFNPNAPLLVRSGSNAAMTELVKEMNSGLIGAVIMAGVNPSYTLPNATEFNDALAKVDLTVSFSLKADETAANVKYLAAAPHYLESWGDVERKSGQFGLIQPAIRPLFDTLQFQDALLAWMGSAVTYYSYLKTYWTENVLNGSEWNQALHDGCFTNETTSTAQEQTLDLSNSVAALASAQDQGMALILYPKIGMGDGQQANNPWLQEFPDPLTRVTWDNYLTMAISDAKELGLFMETDGTDATGGLNGRYAEITVNGKTLKAPVIIQPGQAKGTVGLSFGYGRSAGVKEELQTGVNAYPLYDGFNATQTVTVKAVEGKHEFACVQLHNTLMGRGDIIKETTLEVFNTKSAKEWNAMTMVSLNHVETPVDSPDVDLWDEFDRSIGHHFNLSVDLNACTGCGACVIACHAENNVPVVGKEEIRRSRDMHWLRIDRYYSSEDTFGGDDERKDNISGLSDSLSVFGKMELPSENPQVAFQPIMCQHCNHAPCETVCPVAATSHSKQGQNHMAYNRCVGTRYCANNCPYKVRRFNWFLYNNNDQFDYHMNDDLGRMVINPDVTVRSRGVMEKCSMCIQMTQKTILDAKRDGRVVKTDEFQTACSSACNNGALVFGDINEKTNQIVAKKNDERAYYLLDHIGTKPNVMYQVKVRNTKEV